MHGHIYTWVVLNTHVTCWHALGMNTGQMWFLRSMQNIRVGQVAVMTIQPQDVGASVLRGRLFAPSRTHFTNS